MMVWAIVINLVLGLWFIASPYVLRFTTQRMPMELSILGGGILVVLSLWELAIVERRRQVWIDYVTGAVGLWFIAFPFVYKLQPVPNLMWSSIVGGAIAALLSGYLAAERGVGPGTGARAAHA